MNVPFDFAAFVVGSLGAVAHEALRWVSLRTQHRLPAYLGQLHYWILTFVLVLIGGLLSAVLQPTSVSQALFIGISAPSILSRIGATAPRRPTLATRRQDESVRPSWREFLRG